MSPFTQFASPRAEESCEVVVGFDFGTSCSKVVLRTPHHHGARAVAVTFGDAAHSSSQHLFPSVLWITNDNETSLAKRRGAVLVRDIKYHLMRDEPVQPVNGADDARSYDHCVVAVAFLAHALRSARQWFIRTQHQLYGAYTLQWTFNLGLPSADFADQSLCQRYERIAKAAWWLSVTSSTVTLGAAQEALQSAAAWESLNDDLAAEIDLVPEVLAEVVGYARSDRRNEGLHILVDVGASTLDVCSFILHKSDGDDCYVLLTADVRMLGAKALYEHRVDGVKRAVDAHVGELLNCYDPVSPMPDDPSEYMPSRDALARSIDQHNEKYMKRCTQCIWQTLVDLKTRRDPRSPRWKSTMPVFASGGGSVIPFYQSAMDKLSLQLKAFYVECEGIDRRSLSKPTSLVADVDEQTYHRLAVAWGLSFPKTDIGRVCRPCEISDIEPAETYVYRNEFVSKDMV